MCREQNTLKRLYLQFQIHDHFELVLYFQPKGDGTTSVKRLRVGPDGQLIDRWPGGFFEERYKDIFDE